MKSEFLVIILCLPNLGGIRLIQILLEPKLLQISDSILLILFFIILLITIPYFIEYYKFKKWISNISINSKENLYELYYEIKARIKADGYRLIIMTPFFLLVFTLVLLKILLRKKFDFNEIITSFNIFEIVGLSVIFTIIFTLLTSQIQKLADKSYEEPLSQIKKLIDQLKENETM